MASKYTEWSQGKKIQYSCKYKHEQKKLLVNCALDNPNKFYCIPCGKNVFFKTQRRGDVVHYALL